MKFNIFVSTATIFVLSQFAYDVYAQRPPVDGYNDGVRLNNAPTADVFCDGKTQTETEIDFFHSVVTENTLHKPDGKLVYDNVGKVRGKEVNLVVRVFEGDYTSAKFFKNGKGSNSAGEIGKGMFGNINLQTKKNDFHSGEGNFEMCFRDKETDELVTVDSFRWSVYDIDERNDRPNGIKEKFSIDITQAVDYVLWPNTEESEVKLFCENFSLWPYRSASQVNQLPCNEGERIVFHSSKRGVGSDNPTDKDDLTDLQKSRSVQFTFVNTSCFRFTYNHYCPPDEVGSPRTCSWYGGGNMLFAGSSKQLIEEGECVTEKPTPSATNSPSASPTPSPTASPTSLPTPSPTAKPTMSPTMSPTTSPSIQPTASPSSSPTKQPSKNPTASPTVSLTERRTKSPTKEPTNTPFAVSTTPPPIGVSVFSLNDDGVGTFFEPDKTCPDDVKLKNSKGLTPFPSDISSAVKILSQDQSTVTVQLIQSFNIQSPDSNIDQIYYQFKNSLFNKQCYEEMNVDSLKVYAEEVTIQCNIMTPYAYLEICLVDDVSKNFLDESEDNAEIPKCCHHDSDGSSYKSTVCYALEISCKTKCADTTVDHRRRSLLRGR